MNKTRIIVQHSTTSSVYRKGDTGFVDGYVYNTQYKVNRVIIVLDKDGSFHSVPLTFIKHEK